MRPSDGAAPHAVGRAVRTHALIATVAGLATAAGAASGGTERPQLTSATSAGCADYVVIDSRGSGEPGGFSAPGAVFNPTFRAAVFARAPAARVAVVPNDYPAWGSIPTL